MVGQRAKVEIKCGPYEPFDENLYDDRMKLQSLETIETTAGGAAKVTLAIISTHVVITDGEKLGMAVMMVLIIKYVKTKCTKIMMKRYFLNSRSLRIPLGNDASTCCKQTCQFNCNSCKTTTECLNSNAKCTIHPFDTQSCISSQQDNAQTKCSQNCNDCPDESSCTFSNANCMYVPAATATDLGSCVSAGCNAGERVDNKNNCVKCSVGKYQPEYNYHGDTCKSCEYGKFVDTTGAKNVNIGQAVNLQGYICNHVVQQAEI